MKLKEAYTQKQLNQVCTLYEESFPDGEKRPFQMILEGREAGNYEILVIEDDEEAFLGLAITMLYGELVLLDYFAVSPTCRGTGVGSEALKALQKRYEGRRLLLEIESTVGMKEGSEMSGDSGNAAEAVLRRRRKEFYLRNGMHSMDFLIDYFGVEMELMTYQCSVTFEEYHSILERNFPAHMADRVRLLSD